VYKVGDRVRMVHTTDSFATVVGELETSPVDGGPRLPVCWDRTGKTNAWDPAFLRSADSDPADDPDEVRSGVLVSRRARGYVDDNGVLVLEPGGLRRVYHWGEEGPVCVREE